MKYLKLGLDLFLRHIVLSLLIVLELTASIALINSTLANYNTFSMRSKLFSPFVEQNAVYLMPADQLTNTDNARPPSFDRLKHLSYQARIKQYSFKIGDDAYLNAYAYDDYTLDRFSFPLRRGQGFSGQPEGTIPVFVNQEIGQLHYGKTIDLPLSGYTNEPITTPIRLYVAGVLDGSGYYPEFTAGGGINSNNIICQTDQPMLFLRQSDMKQFDENYLLAYHTNSLLYFDPDISKRDYLANLDELKKDSMVLSLDTMAQEGQKETTMTLRSLLPMGICVFAISLVGIVGFLVLHTLNQMRNFSIYYICGCRWRDCVFLCWGFLFWVLGLTLLLLGGIAAWLFSGTMMAQLGLHFAWNNVLFTAGAFLLAFLSASLPPYLILRKTPPVTLLHTQN